VRLFAALAATWPPAEVRRLGSWTLRRGEDAGRRVSAATLDGPDDDLAAAEAAMRAWGQRPTFMIRPGDERLDAALADRGYVIDVASLIVAAPPAALAPERPDERAILCDAPLARMREIWSAAGVGPSRQAVMARAPGPKTYLFGRAGDAPAACAFVACDREVAMLHALEVSPPFRRQGLGMALARAAVAWAADQGARTCALAVAVANAPARSAYDRLGMTQVAAYHYRLAPEQAVYP
jgi:GNAT superfamily N-acetyltransferase